MPLWSADRREALLFGLILVLVGCHRTAIPRSESALDDPHAISSQQLFEIALFQAQRRDLLRAEQYLTAARQRGYDEARTTYWLVRVCISAGRYHSALRHAAQRLDRNPYEWRLRLVVASLHEALGDRERAQSELENVVRSRPGEPLPRYRLAILYREDPVLSERASEHLSRYLALDPRGVHAQEVRAMLSSPPAPRTPRTPEIHALSRDGDP